MDCAKSDSCHIIHFKFSLNYFLNTYYTLYCTALHCCALLLQPQIQLTLFFDRGSDNSVTVNLSSSLGFQNWGHSTLPYQVRLCLCFIICFALLQVCLFIMDVILVLFKLEISPGCDIIISTNRLSNNGLGNPKPRVRLGGKMPLDAESGIAKTLPSVMNGFSFRFVSCVAFAPQTSFPMVSWL